MNEETSRKEISAEDIAREITALMMWFFEKANVEAKSKGIPTIELHEFIEKEPDHHAVFVAGLRQIAINNINNRDRIKELREMHDKIEEEHKLLKDAWATCSLPKPGEPCSVLLGRDPQAPELVTRWANDRAQFEDSEKQISDARSRAADMAHWKLQHPDIGASKEAYDKRNEVKA